jgi:septal ring factor EnvC (AmiA/AmiB activator)
MRRLSTLMLALLITGGAWWGVAQVDRSEQARIEAEIAAGRAQLEARRTEITAITQQLGATESVLRSRIGERDALSRQLRDLEVQRTNLERGIAQLERDIGRTEVRVAELDADLESLKSRVQGLLVNLHRQRVAGYGIPLAGAETFHDLAVQGFFVNLIAAQDVALVQELDALLRELAAERARLERQLAELAASVSALARNATELSDARIRLDAIIVELRATEAGQLAQQRALLEAQEALEAQLGSLDRALAQEIARLQAEERRLREEAARAATTRERQVELETQADVARARIDNLTGPAPRPSSGFVAPLDSSVVVSRFGERNNSFVALRASQEGAAVRAVQGGVVISVAPIGANDGHLVAVRHDATTTSVYTGLQPPVVVTGDAVNAGTILGYLGGGTLIPPDVLRFYIRRIDGSGNAVFIDPANVLGL